MVSAPFEQLWSVTALSLSSLVRVSHPSQVVLPFPRWEPKEKPGKEDEVGPQVTHIYEVKAQHLQCPVAL